MLATSVDGDQPLTCEYAAKYSDSPRANTRCDAASHGMTSYVALRVLFKSSRNMLVAVVGGPKVLVAAFEAAYLDARARTCITHQIRDGREFVTGRTAKQWR